MSKKIKKSPFFRTILYFVVPVILFLSWILSSVYTLLTYNASFTILPYSHVEQTVISPRQAILVTGTVLHGKLIAKENNLGAIAIRLHNFHGGGVEEDRIIFRLKQEGEKNWYYEHEYTGGQFHELDLFPFGFPIISNSQNKTYVFEIISRYGYNLTSLELTNQNPIVVSQYQFPKSSLIHNPSLLQTFIKKKVTYQLQNLDVKLLLIVYPIPLLLYLFGLSKIGRSLYMPLVSYLKKVKRKNARGKIIAYIADSFSIYDGIVLFVLLIDVFFINGPNETVIVELFILVFIKVIVFESKAHNEFPSALLFLFISSCMLAINYKPSAERAAIWTYVFLMIGTGRLLLAHIIKRAR